MKVYSVDRIQGAAVHTVMANLKHHLKPLTL